MKRVTHQIKAQNRIYHKLSNQIFTKDGFEKLKVEQQELLNKRKQAVSNLKQAREMGDLSENGFYKAARFELNSLDARLRKLATQIKFGRVADSPSKGTIGIGSTVIVSNPTDLKHFTIVGADEASPAENRISNLSPIGKALIGKHRGETIVVRTPSNTIEYTIEDIK